MKYNAGDKFIIEIESVRGYDSAFPYVLETGLAVNEKYLKRMRRMVETPVEGSSYRKGLEDAWKLAGKVFFDSDMGGFESSEIKEIFGTVYAAECFKGDIHEAIKKYKELQEKTDWSTVEVDTPILVKMKQGEPIAWMPLPKPYKESED